MLKASVRLYFITRIGLSSACLNPHDWIVQPVSVPNQKGEEAVNASIGKAFWHSARGSLALLWIVISDPLMLGHVRHR